MNGRKAQKGFTIIELLAVVGIILLLLALLVPGLSAAREKGNRSVCISNQGQLMKASILYAGDNVGHLPFPNEDSLDSWWPNAGGWLYKTPTPSVPSLTHMQGSALWPYIGNEKVYRCPSHVGPFTNGTDRITSYVMNYAVVGMTGSPRCEKPSHRISEFRGTDICFWETDEQWWNYGTGNTWRDGCNQPNGGITRRHNDGAPVACFGGSVEWLTYAQYNALVIPNTRTRAWCNPIKANGHP